MNVKQGEQKMSEIITEESKALIKPVYEDLLQPATKEIGTVLGRTVRALLSPVRGLCWGIETIEQIMTSGVTKKLENVLQEKIHAPEPEIAVPIMLALTYTAQNDTLREMFLNLLANSMNSDFDKVVHPSYVEIVKQMNHLDAVVFAKLGQTSSKYIKAITPNIAIKGTDKVFSDAMPQWFVGWSVENFDIFDVSACLVRLARLGLVELMYDRTAGKDGYENLESSVLITSIFDKHVGEKSNLGLELTATHNVLYVNEFGRQFAKACL